MNHRRKVIILGAAGRDFHNFNVVFRDDSETEVVAFTAAQIPGIAGRRYPPALAGIRYPHGIPIVPETELETLVHEHGITHVVFAYSDVTHEHVMHTASRALAAGADFMLLGPRSTMLPAQLPVIAVSAVRTGCGKSQTARYLSQRLRALGLRVAVIRHPMPYGDLERQRTQRFAERADLEAARCTIEEREEYEPHLAAGNTVHAGVDYAAVLERAQTESDLILWDGGNNDFPFIMPGLHIVLIDTLRPRHETAYHPGEATLRMADVIVAAKADAAAPADVYQALRDAHEINPRAVTVRAGSPVTLDAAADLHGKRVVAVEDGPTITHGGMPYGAALVAATRAGAILVDPRPWAAPDIAAVYAQHPHIGPVLPAMGYSPHQTESLRETLDRAQADAVVAGTPVDLGALVRINKPVFRARYEFTELDDPGLWGEVQRYLDASLCAPAVAGDTNAI